MKIQILTYQRVKGTVGVIDPWVSVTWQGPAAYRDYFGKTPEESRDKLIEAYQKYLDERYTNLTVTEVELAPKTVNKLGKPT
jgi:hypothetical protein